MTGDAMLAADLDWARWPEWLATDLTYRFGATAGLDTLGAKRSHSWRVYYRAAIDHSGLAIVPRNVLRVLLDRTTGDGPAPTVPPMSAADIGARVPCHPDHANRALAVLETAGWAGVIRRPGQVPIVTLLVPVDAPVDAPERADTPAPRAGHWRQETGRLQETRY